MEVGVKLSAALGARVHKSAGKPLLTNSVSGFGQPRGSAERVKIRLN